MGTRGARFKVSAISLVVWCLGTSVGFAQSPGCGDKGVKDAVISVVRDVLTRKAARYRLDEKSNEEINKFLNQPFQLRGIHMTARDDSIGSKSCSADLYGNKMLMMAVFLEGLPRERLDSIDWHIFPSADGGSVVKVFME